MDLKVCWMYHNIMDLYGDKGNMMVLSKRCQDRDIDITIDTCGIGEEKDLSDYDLVFLGGGADKEQRMLIDDLLARKANIQKAMDEKTFFLLICGGYQLFGQYYIDANQEKINGLGFYNYYTKAADAKKRCIGNIVIKAQLDGKSIVAVGFENHGGQTMNVDKPLGKVIYGYGNSFDSHEEGFYDGKVLGTYMHGPLLPKNPKIADFVIYKALLKRNQLSKLSDLKPLDDSLEKLAQQKVIEKCKAAHH